MYNFSSKLKSFFVLYFRFKFKGICKSPKKMFPLDFPLGRLNSTKFRGKSPNLATLSLADNQIHPFDQHYIYRL